jgi:hypothetical protein
LAGEFMALGDRLRNSINRVMEKRVPLLFFSLFYFVWAAATYKNFGFTWNEVDVYPRGMALFQYLFGRSTSDLTLQTSPTDQTVYDHIYPLVLYLLNRGMSVDYYHWLNLFFAFPVFWAVYEVLLDWCGKPFWAFMGPLFLFLMPRFSGDIPGNPKDVTFAVSYFLSLTALYFLTGRQDHHSGVKVLILGILFGLTQSLRIIGFSIYIVFILFEIYCFLLAEKSKEKNGWKWLSRFTVEFISIFLIAGFLMAVTWPFIGANFFKRLMAIMLIAKKYAWTDDVLFMGRYISSVKLPWFYLPVWFWISTPISEMFLWLSGMVWIARLWRVRLCFLVGSALAVNIGLFYLLRPVVYDGMRHFLFLAPLIVVVACVSFRMLYQKVSKPVFQRGLLFLIAFDLSGVAWHMARLHPYEYIYFNGWAGGLKGAAGRYETDYFAASMKETVQKLGETECRDSHRTYQIKACTEAALCRPLLMDNMVAVDNIENADYYISFDRWKWNKRAGTAPLLFTVDREGVPLFFAYKMRPVTGTITGEVN